MYARGLQSDGRSLYELYTVSIHACAKIATETAADLTPDKRDFNSCMREDCNAL